MRCPIKLYTKPLRRSDCKLRSVWHQSPRWFCSFRVRLCWQDLASIGMNGYCSGGNFLSLARCLPGSIYHRCCAACEAEISLVRELLTAVITEHGVRPRWLLLRLPGNSDIYHSSPA